MSINRVSTWIAVAVVALAASPRVHAAPAWCSTPNLKARLGEANHDVDNALAKKSSTALGAIVRATCFPDNEARQRMREVDAARATWTKKLGMTEQDWKDVAAWAAEDGMSLIIYDHEIAVGDLKKKYAISTLSPSQQFAGILNYVPSATAPGSTSYSASLYLADALGPSLSETGRLALIQQCTEAQTSYIELVICDAEIQRLDRKKLLAEIRADTTASGKLKTILRIKLMQLDKRLEWYAAKVKELEAENPVSEKMFEIAAATRKEWDVIWKTEAKLLELALAMDDARQTASRATFAGCSDKTWAAWSAQVAKIPASRFAGLTAEAREQDWIAYALAVITSTPTGYLASVALFSCHFEARGKESIISGLGRVMANLPGLRGPRLATQSAIANAGLVDDPKQLDLPNAGQDWLRGDVPTGVFATVARVGKPDVKGMAVVTFAKKTEKQERCLRTRRTNRINRILDDGTFIYYVDCLKWGVATIDKTPEPVSIDKRFLTNVKPGMNVFMTWSAGALGAVFPKRAKNPVAVFGVEVR